MRGAFGVERARHLKDVRHVLQAARTDAVGALLVFLHLLERDLERLAQLLLAHAEHLPAHPQPAAYVLVDRIWRLHGLSCDRVVVTHSTVFSCRFAEVLAFPRFRGIFFRYSFAKATDCGTTPGGDTRDCAALATLNSAENMKR